MAALAPTDAIRLDGNRGLFRVVIEGPAERQGYRDVYEVLPRDDPQGILFLTAGPDVEGALTVEATLTVIRHPTHVVGATITHAFLEYRLVDAH